MSHITIEDLKGLAGLMTDATVGVTDLVEEMNKKIVHPPFLPSTPVQKIITGVSGTVFKGVRAATTLIGGGIQKGLGQINPKLNIGLSFKKKERLLSVLNGVVGDYLNEKKNPLAIEMQLRFDGERLAMDGESLLDAIPKLNGKILILVHGLCLDDLRWTRKDHNHGEALAAAFNYTPIYLKYNTGLPISTNGQEFNNLLNDLIESWPVDVEEIVVLAHSMGGLVSRSAVHYGQNEKSRWTKQLKKIIFLGTPHHGAPLERIGNFVDHIFDNIHYVKPFARLGKMRSSGITDLRYGNVVDEDWKGLDRFENNSKTKQHIPLPKKVESYAIAATKGAHEKKIKTKLVGDGLVQLESALGKHKEAAKTLKFKKANTHTVFETSHSDLLSSEEVFDKIKNWLNS